MANPMKTKVALVLCLCSGLAALEAAGQDSSAWRQLASEQGRSVELNTTSVHRDQDGTILATSRLVLAHEITDLRSGGAYKYLQTTSRYDCQHRAVATLRRTFIKTDDQVLREDEMKDIIMLPVRSSTVDDRILRELCRPPGQGQTAQAEEAPKPKPSVREQLEAIKAVAAVRLGPIQSQTIQSDASTRRTGRSGAATSYSGAAASRSGTRPIAGGSRQAAVPSSSSSEHALCAQGLRQSPIDIRDGIEVDLEPLAFDYRPSLFAIFDTGHGIEVKVVDNRLSLLGKSYALERVQLFRPAEEVLEGRKFDMGVHLEHLAADGERLIVAVLLEKGAPHPLIQTLWNYLPLEKHLEVRPPAASIDLNQLLPEDRSYHTYMGSLTRPPCSEGVIWVVLKTPIQLSPEQEAIFARLYAHNARPVQPTQGRLIKSSRTKAP
jgi:carbonic anhydrase